MCNALHFQGTGNRLLRGLAIEAILLLATREMQAATILGYGGASGPGLGSVVTPTFGTPAPVNDNVVGASPNTLIISEKHFDNVAIIDMEFGVNEEPVPGATVTEYQVREIIFNDTGVTWSGHNVQLGYGTGAGFVLSTAGDGLDFDDTDLDSIFAFGPFTSPTIGADTLDMTGGTVPNGGSFVLEFALDVPNIPLSHKFTIRQLVRTGAVIPEPSAFALAVIGLLSLGSITGRRKRR